MVRLASTGNDAGRLVPSELSWTTGATLGVLGLAGRIGDESNILDPGNEDAIPAVTRNRNSATD